MSIPIMFNADCLDALTRLSTGNVDMILTDLPYGMTANKWDVVIPFAPMWAEFLRVCKPTAAIVLTASQPFTTLLISSNLKLFRYELIWNKMKGGNFLLAKKQPMKSHENICVFYRNQPTYNPQKEIRGNPRKKGGSTGSTNFSGIVLPEKSFNNEYYPKSIIEASTGSRVDHFHPTQKPVELMRYLIRTYSNPGETVLDATMGSGTTGVAALQEGRHFIGIERDPHYFLTAQMRVLSEVM